MSTRSWSSAVDSGIIVDSVYADKYLNCMYIYIVYGYYICEVEEKDYILLSLSEGSDTLFVISKV